MTSESEMKRMDLAVLYELRLIFSESEKDTFTKAEIVELLDQIAITKSNGTGREPGPSETKCVIHAENIRLQ